MAALRCPVCNQIVDQQRSPAMPFCSQRCRQIDLGRWLRETYGMPVERDPDNEEGEAVWPSEQE